MMERVTVLLAALPLLSGFGVAAVAQDIVRDAEDYVLLAQNGEKWQAGYTTLAQQLADLREKHGCPPNMVYLCGMTLPFVMWGYAGHPANSSVWNPSPQSDG